jgi:hypothetical protein
MTDDPETQYDHPAIRPPTEWGKRRSWHICRPGSWTGLCGIEVFGRARLSMVPLNEKTCETCLRLDKHYQDKETA